MCKAVMFAHPGGFFKQDNLMLRAQLWEVHFINSANVLPGNETHDLGSG